AHAPAAAPQPVAAAPDAKPAASSSHNGARATPVARRVAQAHDVALEELEGTGPRGRITRADVLRAAGVEVEAEPAVVPAAAEAVAPASVSPPPAGEIREPTRLQQLVARRMAEAKATIPHFQVETEVAMDAAAALRAQLKAAVADGAAP